MKNLKIVLLSLGLAAVSAAESGVAHAAGGALRLTAAPFASTAVSLPRLFGGEGNDQGYYAFCDKGGACTVVGSTVGSVGDAKNYLLADFDLTGKPVWARTFGGSGKDDLGFAIATGDGGTLLGGISFSRFWDMTTYENGRTAILKLDHGGKLQWVKLMQNKDGDDLSVTRFEAAAQGADGSYVLAGEYLSPPEKEGDYWPSDLVVLKAGGDGKVLWLRHYHFKKNTGAGALMVAADGSIRVYARFADDDNEHDHPLLLTLDSDGTPRLAVEYVGDDDDFFADAVGAQADGKLILSGETEVFKDGKYVKCQATLLRVNPDGSVVDEHAYFVDGGFAAERTLFQSDGIVLVGYTGSAVGIVRAAGGPEEDGIALALDNQGGVKAVSSLGTKQRNPGGNGDTEFWGVSPVATGKYFLVGSTDAFGKGDADFLTALWAPSAGSGSLVKTLPLDLKAQPLDLPAAITMDVANVRDLPAGRVDVNEVAIEKTDKQ